MVMRKRRTQRAAVATTSQLEPIQTPSVLPWVASMIQHFNATGLYRPEDVRRVLGDPREGIEVKIDPFAIPHPFYRLVK
jgi:hypothetical protein